METVSGKTVKWNVMVHSSYLTDWQGGAGAQWVARLTRNRWMPVSREFESHQRLPSLCKKLETCLVLVGSRNGFDRDLHKKKELVSQSN